MKRITKYFFVLLVILILGFLFFQDLITSPKIWASPI